MSIALETAKAMEEQTKMYHPDRVPTVDGDGLYPFEKGRLLLFERGILRGELSGTYMGCDPEVEGYVFIVPTVAEKDSQGNVTKVEPLQFGVPFDQITSGTVKTLRERFQTAVTEVAANPGLNKNEPIARILLCDQSLLT